MNTQYSRFNFAGALALIVMCCMQSPHASAGPKGSQFLTTEMLQDTTLLKKTVDAMTDDTKGKQFGKTKRVVIPTYYIEFRTVSSGKALKKGLKDISVNATVTYTNPDQVMMEAIATEGLADLKARFAAAGYEVVDAGDISTLEPYKNLKMMQSGTLAESTAQPIGWSKFKAIFASAGGTPIYFSIPGEPDIGQGMAGIFASAAMDGTAWKAAGGEGTGVVRSRMIIDFVTFIADTGVKYDAMAGVDEEKFKNYASISAIPQIQVWLPSLCTTRTYIFFGGRVGGDDFGCVNVKPEIQLASKVVGDTLGTVEDKDGTWLFTANNDTYKEAALEQIRVANILMVEKAKTFK